LDKEFEAETEMKRPSPYGDAQTPILLAEFQCLDR